MDRPVRPITNTLGLLIVHGIGNQLAGDLPREVAVRLADGDAGHSGAAATADPDPERRAASAGVPQRITVGQVPVVVGEANWADLSWPDRPPRVRLANPIVRDYCETVPAAWRRSLLGTTMRRLDRRRFAHSSVVFLVVAGLLLGAMLIWPLVMIGAEPPLLLSSLFFLVFMGLTGHFAVRSGRYRLLRLRRATRWKRWFVAAVFATGSFVAVPLVGMLAVVFVAEFLLFFAAPVAIAYVVGSVFAALAAAIRWMAWTMRSPRLMAVQRWIHRLTAVILVLPCHAFLQSIRAAGNLVSIMLAERGWARRFAAAGWLLGVYVLFAALLVLCEILLFPVLIVVVLWSGGSTAGELIGLTLAVLAVGVVPYMLFIKLCLPAIDLVLDVANYHLADAHERREYHERIESGIVQLMGEGCAEIHVLAHSLGTVLVYDWLRSTARGKYPIAVLYTVGSPLDRFWYVDHGVSRRRADREGLSAQVSRAWVNFWALSDPVSSRLRNYDCPALCVANERLQGLGWFPLSHVRYWSNPTVLARVRTEIDHLAAPKTARV